MLGVVNKLFAFNITQQCKGDGIKSRLLFKNFCTLSLLIQITGLALPLVPRLRSFYLSRQLCSTLFSGWNKTLHSASIMFDRRRYVVHNTRVAIHKLRLNKILTIIDHLPIPRPVDICDENPLLFVGENLHSVVISSTA